MAVAFTHQQKKPARFGRFIKTSTLQKQVTPYFKYIVLLNEQTCYAYCDSQF